MNNINIYWIVMLDSIKICLLAIILCHTPLIMGSFLKHIETNLEDAKIFLCKCFSSLFILIMIYAFIPSTKNAVLIYILPKIINNEHIQNISTDSLDLIELSLEYLKDKLVENNGINKYVE